MDLGLNGKIAVVTGASRGIGRAIATRLADEGAGVAVCARGEPALRELEAELGTRRVPVYADVCDVGDAVALARFLDAAHGRFGRIDILVNNPSGLAFADDEAAWQSVLAVDLMAAVRACWKVVPWMAAGGGGAIVHVSSLAGVEAVGFPAAYGAAKAALISHAKTLAVSLAPQKIRVNTVAPGPIEFPGGFWDQMKQNRPDFYAAVLQNIPWRRMGTVNEVADVVAFLASERARWVTGVCLVIDGAQHKANL
jgi:3-oxoacyl-[acyl-carrier protein] reductase